uniref:Uncharacterized protein n=1 Tax=Anguilla anguilla TaxID=7936 RepID=A0A0E9RD93_ANGAN
MFISNTFQPLENFVFLEKQKIKIKTKIKNLGQISGKCLTQWQLKYSSVVRAKCTTYMICCLHNFQNRMCSFKKRIVFRHTHRHT